MRRLRRTAFDHVADYIPPLAVATDLPGSAFACIRRYREATGEFGDWSMSIIRLDVPQRTAGEGVVWGVRC